MGPHAQKATHHPWGTKRRLEHLSRSSTKMLSGVSPCEDPNEASYPHVRESVETVPSSLIDPIFGLVYVLLRELLLQACQGISARPFQRVHASRTQDLSPHSYHQPAYVRDVTGS